LEQGSYLFAEFWFIRVPMSGYCVLNGSVKHLFFCASNLERALVFAWIESAINRFSLLGSGHEAPPCEFKLLLKITAFET